MLDSIESQANRLEALLRENVQKLPQVVVRFGENFEVSQYSAPHRIFDALFLWSELVDRGGKRVLFRDSEIIKAIEGADRKRAEEVLFRYSPLVLLLGGWHSHGRISPERAPRWPRILTLEIIGAVETIDKDEPLEVARTSSRNEPTSISGSELLSGEMAKVVMERLKENDSKEKPKASHAGLGKIPPTVQFLDAVVAEAYLQGAISLVGLRNLTLEEEAKEVLLLLALLGLALQHEGGYRLRSGADLVAQGELEVSLFPTGRSLVLKSEELKEALEIALNSLPKERSWPEEGLVLKAGEDLEKLFEKNRKKQDGQGAGGKAEEVDLEEKPTATQEEV